MNGNLKYETPLNQTETDSSSDDSLLSKQSNSSDDEESETNLLFKDKLISKNEFLHEQLALDALNNWEKFTSINLVPEHVETRSLYNPESGPDLEQGKIQMWIDMFPINENRKDTFKTVDISVRK
jgi:hypothetical protein